MPPVSSYQCALCREELRFCKQCRRYVHEARWSEHCQDPLCPVNGIGLECEPLLSWLDRTVARLLRLFSLCTVVLIITWLIWAQVVDAWDASYRAGWLP